MSQLSVTKVHGSRNDILVVDGAPDDHLASGEVARAVQRLCDRRNGLGSDGVYFIAYQGGGADGSEARAWFFNPDGSPSLLCGNGMRGAGRLLLDRRGVDQVVLHTGPYAFTVRDAGTTEHGVRQVAVQLPAVDFAPEQTIVAGAAGPVVDQVVPDFHAQLGVTMLAVPNSHLVSVVDAYDEADLIATGRRVADTPAAFPIGANVSFILPLTTTTSEATTGPATEVYVQTYERGAGLTPSCGSGNSASRAVLSKLGMAAPGEPVLVRNPGGVATLWLEDHGGIWQPVLQGNATVVYRAQVAAAALVGEGPIPFAGETDDVDGAAFEAFYRQHRAVLAEHGVTPSI